METRFTADLHPGHGNIIKYCNRPFMTPEETERASSDPGGDWKTCTQSVELHDARLLEAIKADVKREDALWIIGDFCLRDPKKTAAFRQRIRCRNVHLIWGNHDPHSLKPLFSSVTEQPMLNVEGQTIWLNHYPMRSWNGSFHGAWQLYGHVRTAPSRIYANTAPADPRCRRGRLRVPPSQLHNVEHLDVAQCSCLQ